MKGDNISVGDIENEDEHYRTNVRSAAMRKDNDFTPSLD